MLIGVSIAIFFPVLSRVIHNPGSQGDYTIHNLFALRMWKEGVIGLPHFLYHIIVVLLMQVMGLSLVNASIVISLISFTTVAPLVRGYLQGNDDSWALNILAITAVLVSPITVTAIFQHGIYTGYIPITVYHSPTMTLMKPLALWNFLLTIRGLCLQKQSRWVYILGFLTLVLATLAKPNYTLALLPAAVCFAFIRWRLGENVSWKYLIGSVILPSILLLGWQYYFTYASQSSFSDYNEASGILFAPFAAVTSDSDYVLLKCAASIPFPAAVSIIFWKHLKRYPEYFLSVFIFVCGCLYFYLLAEPGVYLVHKRFLWSASIGLFLWFVVCLKVLVVEGGLPFSRKQLSLPTKLCYAILFISLINGLVKYLVDGGFLSRAGVGL
jgi:hypothetical protein